MSADGESADSACADVRRVLRVAWTRRIRGRVVADCVGGRIRTATMRFTDSLGSRARGRVVRWTVGVGVRQACRRADVRRGLVRLQRARWARLSVLRTGLSAVLSARRRALRQGGGGAARKLPYLGILCVQAREIFLQKAGSPRERNVADMGFPKKIPPPPTERTARRRAKTGAGSGVKKQSTLPRRAKKKRRIARFFRRLFECTFLLICLSGIRPKARNSYTDSEHFRHRTRRTARLPALRDRRMAHRCPARPLRRVQRLLSRLFALLFCTSFSRG